MTNKKENHARKNLNGNRVLVFKVDAPRRPFVSTSDLLITHRPHDWSVFGAEVCHQEMSRRKAIHRLMTEDERKFFDKYCRLRDE